MAEVWGSKFPAALSVPGVQDLHIIAAGMREKRIAIVNVKVYAVAFYADQAAAKEALAGFKGQQGHALSKDGNFFTALVEGQFEKAYTMILQRDLSHDQFVGGLVESLDPKLKAVSAPPETLKSFEAAFQGFHFQKNAHIHLALTPSAVHLTLVPAKEGDGNKTAVLESAQLVHALNDVYLGGSSPSPSLKNAIADWAAKSL